MHMYLPDEPFHCGSPRYLDFIFLPLSNKVPTSRMWLLSLNQLKNVKTQLLGHPSHIPSAHSHVWPVGTELGSTDGDMSATTESPTGKHGSTLVVCAVRIQNSGL